MLERFRVEGYKALRDVTVDLSPVHVLIGANDTGKSSILQALAAFSRSTDHPLPEAFAGLWEGRQLVWAGAEEPVVRFTGELRDARGAFTYSLACRFGESGREVTVSSEEAREGGEGESQPLPGKGDRTALFRYHLSPERKREVRLHQAVAGVQTYRFSPPLLGLPVAQEAKVYLRMHPTGFSLAMCLDDILGADRKRFDALESRFREVFPEIASIKLVRGPGYRVARDDPAGVPLLQKAEGKGIFFELRGRKALVPAAQASDGTLLVLAYLAVLHLPKPPRFLLVEEPENGIHPGRLDEILGAIRETVGDGAQTQILLTTHSPYLLDLFEPEEVTVCRKDASGAVLTRRLSESPEVERNRDIFTLGEIWTSRGEDALAGEGVSGVTEGE